MIVRNEPRLPLQIDGVIDGPAAVVGNTLAFRPNLHHNHPADVLGGILDGRPIRLSPVREGDSPIWTATFEYLA